MAGRKPGPHGHTEALRISLPASLAARIAAWGEREGVPRVKGRPNLSGAIARWAESLPEMSGE